MPIKILPKDTEKRKAKRGQTKGGEGHWWTATDPKKPHRSVYQETLDKKLRPMRKKGIKSGTRHARGLTPQERWKHIPESWKGKQGGKVASGWKLTTKPKTQSTLTGTDTTHGGGPDSGNVGYNKDFIYRAGKQRKKLKEEMEKRKKRRPERTLTPYRDRAKKGIGGVIKKGISQILKPKGVFKPKPKPKEVDVDKLLKNLGDEIKAQPIPPKIQKKIKELQKAYPHHGSTGKLKK